MNNKKKKSILVFGANGQLGYTLYRKVANRDAWPARLHCTKDVPEPVLEYNIVYLGPYYKFIFADIEQCDIANPESLKEYLDRIKPDYIVNCAAFTDVNKIQQSYETQNISEDSKKYYDLATAVNVDAPIFMADWCNKNNKHFIHISTNYVYDCLDGAMHLFKEDDKRITVNNFSQYEENGYNRYALMKYIAETEIELLRSGSNYVIFRTSWLYGDINGVGRTNNFISFMIKNAMKDKSIIVTKNEIGTPTYAPNLADAILNYIFEEMNHKMRHIKVVNFSDEGMCSRYDFAVAICDELSRRSIMNDEGSVIRNCVSSNDSADFEKKVNISKRPFFTVMDLETSHKMFWHCLNTKHWTESLREFVYKNNEKINFFFRNEGKH